MTLEVDFLPKGPYFLRIENDNNYFVYPIIKE